MLQILDDTTGSTQQQWLKFMLERVGHNNLPQLLEYYESIGWISIDVTDRLLSLAENEKIRYKGPTWTLSPQEHRTSMLFIEKLQGRQVDIPTTCLFSPARANPEPDGMSVKPRESYLEAHRMEKIDMEFTIQRREVTIKNLERELEKKDLELIKLKERIEELEILYQESQTELGKHRMYREILEENIRLRRAGFSVKCKNSVT